MSPEDDSSTRSYPPRAAEPVAVPLALTQLQPGAEVVPGYTLVARLGRGGFGEVWKATAPGDVPVAFKFVRCEGASAAVEARALEFMKHVAHPDLLTTFGVWHRDDLLAIGMDLADETLMDRLRRAEREGRPGVPAEELLEYMREAAKGIDFLNEPRHAVGGEAGVSITHRDIKPQNLLLVGGGVKVGDFGLARVVDRNPSTRTGGLTPAYAAPEFFRGEFHRQSDQYSLAVSYVQLRCGRLPFAGGPLEVMAGHLHGSPDVGPLPAGERGPVLRALARHPGDRWPSCRAFVQQLAGSGGPAGGVTPPEPDLLVDTTPILGAGGDVTAVPYSPGMAVWVLLADVFYLIREAVGPFTYGRRWVLRDADSGRVFDVGSPWARVHGLTQDSRQLSAVGIRPGMRLEVVPLRG